VETFQASNLTQTAYVATTSAGKGLLPVDVVLAR
jgi:hypothetical protein